LGLREQVVELGPLGLGRQPGCAEVAPHQVEELGQDEVEPLDEQLEPLGTQRRALLARQEEDLGC